MSKENDDDRVGGFGSKEALAQRQWNLVVHGIGLVTIEFQRLESVIKMAIWELVAATPKSIIGGMITAELSFKGASHLLYALAESRWENSGAVQALDDILGRVIRLKEREIN